MLGSAVANVLDVFNPELVVLGGGVTRAGDQLLIPVREAARRQAMPPARDAVDPGDGEDGHAARVRTSWIVRRERRIVPGVVHPA